MVSPTSILDSTNSGLNAFFYPKDKYKIDDEGNQILIGQVDYVKLTKNLTNQVIWDGKASDEHKKNFYIEYQSYKGNADTAHEEAIDLKNLNIDAQTIEILKKRQIKNIRQLANVPTESAYRLGGRGQEIIMQAQKYMEKLKVKLEVLEVTKEKDKQINALIQRIEALEAKNKPKKKVKNDIVDDSTERSEKNKIV